MNDVSILVVDDDDDVRAALCDELSSHYAITPAAGGAEAFAALATRPFDVIISDLRMPDHDGIEVLDFARDQQPGIIRILLTGYTDERAHSALLVPDAPYKVGKPWHDEIEVVLARTLEQRRRTRQLSASLEGAFGLAQLERAFADVNGLAELGEAVALRVAAIGEVGWCGCVLDGVTVAGQRDGGVADGSGDGWLLALPIDGDGRLQLLAGGQGDETREVVRHIAAVAQRRAGLLTPAAPTHALDTARPTRSRLDELMRQATVGAMAGMLIHDIAGIIQSIEGAIGQVDAIAAEREDAELGELAADLGTASGDVLALFKDVRKFIRDGRPALRPIAADELVDRALRQVGGLVRARATLKTTLAPGVMVNAAPALAVHVLCAVLRNAGAASPPGGVVDVVVAADGDGATVSVTDDGPGVPPELAGMIFDAQVWQRPGGVGTGLAIAAHAIQAQGGSIAHHRAPGRGACFTVRLPRAE